MDWGGKTGLDFQTDQPPTVSYPPTYLFILCSSVRALQSSHIGLIAIVDGAATEYSHTHTPTVSSTLCNYRNKHTVDNSRQHY